MDKIDSSENIIKIILKNNSLTGRKGSTTNVDDRELVFYQADAEAMEQEPVKISRYGMYSVAADISDYRLSVLCDEEAVILLDTATAAQLRADEYMSSYKSGFMFSTFEGIVKLQLAVDDQLWFAAVETEVSKPDDSLQGEQELKDMFLRIYEEQPLLLYSVFRKSPMNAFLDEDSHIENVIDRRIELLKKCLGVYRSNYSQIRRSLKYNLKSYEYVDRIDKLNQMNSQTIGFIAQNPQYLMEVKRDKGIKHNGKVYLPSKTLVSRNVFNYDIYENRYIVTFIKMLSLQCAKLKTQLNLAIANAETESAKAVNKSQRADFEALAKVYRNNLHTLSVIEPEIRKYYKIYLTMMGMDQDTCLDNSVGRPKSTAIFRQIPEYNVMFKEAFIPWFDYGISIRNNGINANAFTIALSNPSTTYELYIVTEWINYFQSLGFEANAKRAKYAGVHEKESRYTDYAYEFVFERDEEELVLFYSPSVYIPRKSDEDEFTADESNVDEILYRDSKNSRVRNDEDSESGRIGSHYEPDFIIKYTRGNTIRYIMADAKHKEYKIVVESDVPDLEFQYIRSIKVFGKKYIKSLKDSEENWSIRVAGLVAIYHLQGEDDHEDYHEFSNLSDEEEPFVKMMYMNINEKDNPNSWQNVMNRMLISIGCNPDELSAKTT